ncbi:hypothetical protein FRB91_010947 [Serendipita sp. 411]|nr:hypothetical protein FRB91_010947 [Serendipita sp. 411]
MVLSHGTTVLPAFMPVATQAALKGLTPLQVEQLGISLILNNTYHLGLRPGIEILEQAGGAHAFQGWRKNLLTDSGGFQLVSLSSFTEITEKGALFASPFTGEPTMLTPEESIRIQHAIGADIIMQLDDVVSSLTTGPRVKESMQRSVRWLDRCIAYHKASGNDKTQNLFAIIQGGLDANLRKECLTEMVKRKDDIPGFAIGGLSGGEEKDIFWKMIKLCTDDLPEDRPRYSMGIGFAEGLSKHSTDFRPVDDGCPCPTCTNGTSRALLHSLITHETVAAHAITQHNLVFQARLVGQARDAIMEDRYPQYLKNFFQEYFGTIGYPRWCIEALRTVGVDLLEDVSTSQAQIKIVEGDGAKWEYSEANIR